LVALPLAVAGSLSAHEIAWWVVSDQGVAGGPRHAYLSYAPLTLSVLTVVLLAALITRAIGASRGRLDEVPSAWWFFALPPAGFLLQEHVEQLVAGGGFPFGTVLEPTFLVGLALQLPFALAAFAFARLLLRVADRIGRALAPERRPVPARPVRAAFPSLVFTPRRPGALALGYGKRGPPLVVV
jgi:hypothetical protein